MLSVDVTANQKVVEAEDGKQTKTKRDDPVSCSFQLPVEESVESLVEYLGGEEALVNLAIQALKVKAQAVSRQKLEHDEEPEAVKDYMESEWDPTVVRRGTGVTTKRAAERVLKDLDALDKDTIEAMKKRLAELQS